MVGFKVTLEDKWNLNKHPWTEKVFKAKETASTNYKEGSMGEFRRLSVAEASHVKRANGG